MLRSGYDGTSIQPRRSHLAAHDRVLASTMAAGPVLPFRFGVVAEDPAVLPEALDPAAAHERLRSLAGKAEVQILWEPDEDAAIHRAAQRHPAVRDPAIPAVDRGRMIADVIQQLAIEDLSAIVDQVRHLATTTDRIEPRGTAARVAVLVDAGRIDDLLATCQLLAERARAAGTLRTVGALPPYSFTDLDRDLVVT